MPNGTTMDSHSSMVLPPLFSISQNAGKAERAVISDPQKYTRVRPMRSDRWPKNGMKKHIAMAAAITPTSASVRLIWMVWVR
ncbi:hypothetical protein D3C86_1752180 [compost metagenome]